MEDCRVLQAIGAFLGGLCAYPTPYRCGVQTLPFHGSSIGAHGTSTSGRRPACASSVGSFERHARRSTPRLASVVSFLGRPAVTERKEFRKDGKAAPRDRNRALVRLLQDAWSGQDNVKFEREGEGEESGWTATFHHPPRVPVAGPTPPPSPPQS